MTLSAIFGLTIVTLAGCLAGKMKIGPALAVSSITLLVLSQKLHLFPNILFNVLHQPLTYWVLAVIGGVSVLGSLLKHLNKIPKLVVALESLIKQRGIVVALLPTIIGALPMPGGAYLSAPMVEKAGKGTSLSKEKLTAVNHWFRHLFEFFLPLYPGYILAVKLCGFDAYTFSSHTFPLAFLGAFAGWLILLRNKRLPSCEENADSPFRLLFSALWPVLLVLIPTLANVPFIVSLYGAIAVTAIIYRLCDRNDWTQWLNNGFSVKMTGMIFGIFLFRECIESTGLKENLAPELAAAGLPVEAVLVLVPLVAGLLAGLGVGFVGISYPILLPLITVNGIVSLPHAVLIYSSGWVGMMLSPAHLCLILTAEYFDSKMTKVMQYMVSMSAIMIPAAAALTILYLQQ